MLVNVVRSHITIPGIGFGRYLKLGIWPLTTVKNNYQRKKNRHKQYLNKSIKYGMCPWTIIGGNWRYVVIEKSGH